MPNVKQIIDGHNKTTLKKDSQPPQDQAEKACNCRNKDECPLEGACLTKEVVYQATVRSNNRTETYVGITSTEFKTRWRNHQVFFKNEKRKSETELGKHLWQLKELNLLQTVQEFNKSKPHSQSASMTSCSMDASVPPVAQPHRQVRFHIHKQLEEQLQQGEELRMIERIEGPTPWVSPIVVAPKLKSPDQICVCVDMHQANKAI